jgi:MFS transporter, DHA1 family, multidrug resistance protein
MLKKIYNNLKNYKTDQKPLLGFSVVVLFFSIFDGIISYISPLIITEAGLSKTVMGLIIGSSSFFGAVFDFLLCRLFIKTSFRRVLLVMFVICLVYPLILWQAKIVWVYLIAMALWGLYYDLYSFGKFNFVGRYNKEDHSASFGVISVFENLGYVIAPLIAGLVIFDLVDWRSFVLAAIFIVIAFIAYLFFLNQIKSDSFSRDEDAACKKINFINELKLWKKVGSWIWPLLILSMTISMSEAIFWTIGPLFAENFSFQAFDGLFLTAYALPPLLTGWFIGSFTAKVGKKKTGYFSFIAGSLMLELLIFISSPYMIVLVIFLSSFFMSLSWPSISGAYADYIAESPKVEKEIEGVEDFFSNLGFIIGPILAGILSDHFEYGQVFAFIGSLSCMIAIILMLLTPKKINIQVDIS